MQGSTSMTNNMYDIPGINFKSDFEMLPEIYNDKLRSFKLIYLFN